MGDGVETFREVEIYMYGVYVPALVQYLGPFVQIASSWVTHDRPLINPC